jgi:subtilisin family serine protease
MRRLPAVLLSLVVSIPLLGASIESAAQPKGGARAGRAVILETTHPLTTEDRAELAREQVFVRHALPGGRYLARVADGVQADDSRIVAIEPLTAGKKIHASAYREAVSGRSWAELNVIFHRDVEFDDAHAAIAAAGGSLVQPLTTRFSPSQRLLAKFPPSALEAIASDERVFAVAGPRRWRVASDNARSAAASHVTELYSAPYGLSGQGVVVSLFELGAAESTHVEFGGRLTVVPFAGASGDKMHATHVAGTIGAAGINPNAKGMAPNAVIQQRCVGTGSNGCDSDWLEDKDVNLAPLGVVADNNSWGFVLGWSNDTYPVWNASDVYWGAYDLIVGAPLDEISIEKDILFIHSAGNDGNQQTFAGEWSEHWHVDDAFETIRDKIFCYSVNNSGTDCPTGCTGACETVRHHTLTPYDTQGVTASAKNVVSVGAVSVNETSGAVQIVQFSSRGPAKDGRVKPDVVARGRDVLSTVPNNSYGQNSGTSMAAPAVTGISALLVEQWRKTNGGNPKPAQLKALLIAGTDDLGEPGPDYTFGFGLVNAKSSVDAILADAGRGDRIRTVTLAQGQTQEMSVVVSQAQKLRVVMNWADPGIPYLGAGDIAAKALVNDLDLKVIDPTGATHLPYVLDKNAPSAAATRGVNNVDNVEMVEIANAAPGVYRIVATGSGVTEGPQSAVIVATADLARPCVDIQESAAGNTAAGAYGDLVTGQTVSGGLCTAGDVDYYKFTVTKSGPVTVTVTAGGTPIVATLTGTGVNATANVPANGSATLTGNASTVPLPLLLRIESGGTAGRDTQYSFVPQFGTSTAPRRRAVR